MRYIQEQQEWDGFIRDRIGVNASLVYASTFSSDCRVYKTADATFKVRRITPSSMRNRGNSLEDECLILKELSSVKGVPRVRSYRRWGQWELLEMESLPELRGYDPTLGKPHETVKDFWDVVRITIQINRLGCSHGDLHVHNVGRNVDHGMSVFDFDQACLDHPWRCAMRDIFGLGMCEKRSEVSLVDRLRDVRGVGFFFRAVTRLRREVIKFISRYGSLTGRQNYLSHSTLKQRAMFQGDLGLEMLAEAWSIASRSDASAPGVDIGYYSIDIGGINFPGERPWILRWDRIRKEVDFKGKRLLELGCNMGMLSIHAKLWGATYCLGVDVDKEILRAAELASRAFGTDVVHRQLDLDNSPQWEEELKGFDIVSVLSVLHWIKKKDRVWSYLAKHREVLYEGHESEQEAESNLTRAGFTRIARLGTTERNRQIFHASRA